MRFWLFNTLFIVSCGYALWRGGRDERLCVLIFCAARLGTILAHGATASYTRIEWGVLSVDIAMLAALTGLALASDRYWPLWLAALQLVEVLGHGVILIAPEVISWTYRAMIRFWSYPMLMVLMLATIRRDLRHRTNGRGGFWLNSWAEPLLARLRF